MPAAHLFLIFVFLLRFALFNIMTGVFVERALTAAIPDSQKLSMANPVKIRPPSAIGIWFWFVVACFGKLEELSTRPGDFTLL